MVWVTWPIPKPITVSKGSGLLIGEAGWHAHTWNLGVVEASQSYMDQVGWARNGKASVLCPLQGVLSYFKTILEKETYQLPQKSISCPYHLVILPLF